MNRINLSSMQAQAIMDAHNVWEVLEDEEQRDLLQENNPTLLMAYITLGKIADNQ